MHLRGQCPSFPGDALGCWHLSGWNFHRHHISHVAPKNWSFEVVFVIAPQKRRQGIDIDGSIPAGFFLSIFLLAIQASLLYLGWSVFHFRIFTFCQVINMKISPQWLLVSRIHNNDLDQRHRFLWVSSSTCNLGLWKFTHANRCQLASETWGYRSDYSDNFYMNQDAEWHASSVLHFALLTAIRWFSTSTTSIYKYDCCSMLFLCIPNLGTERTW